MSISNVTLRKRPVVLAASPESDSTKFLVETLEGIRAILGPLSANMLKTQNPKYGSSVVSCKVGKARELIKFLDQQDFTTVDRPIAFVAGGTRLESTGEKTFVNYNAAMGVLLIGTTIQKNSPL